MIYHIFWFRPGKEWSMTGGFPTLEEAKDRAGEILRDPKYSGIIALWIVTQASAARIGGVTWVDAPR